MPKTGSKTATVKELRAAMRKLRSNLGLISYHLYDVTRHKRKRKSDFVAWSSWLSSKVFLVQPDKANGIRIRPFCTAHITPDVRGAMVRTRQACRVRLQSGPQIDRYNKKLRPEDWLTQKGRKELRLVTGIEVSEKRKSRSA